MYKKEFDQGVLYIFLFLITIRETLSLFWYKKT